MDNHEYVRELFWAEQEREIQAELKRRKKMNFTELVNKALNNIGREIKALKEELRSCTDPDRSTEIENKIYDLQKNFE